MAITAKQVKELREMTGSGMMDCKKALTETDGDMDKAVEWLREKGKASAEKKASRIAAEGLVMVKVAEDGKKGVAVEVNSETDFVAKNELFREFVAEVADQAIDSAAADMDAFMAEPWKTDAAKTVKDIQTEKIAVIGENLNIRRFQTVEAADGVVVDYTHMGGKIGVLVQIKSDIVNDAIIEMGKNVAMQIAAMRPKYTSRKEVPADYIEKEEAILLAAIMNDPKESQKPEKVIKGIVKGRVNKEMKEIVLLDQVYVKAEDGKQTVAKYVEETGKANGAKTSVEGFIRFETGEGLEKKNEDFAAEVAAQMKK